MVKKKQFLLGISTKFSLIVIIIIFVINIVISQSSPCIYLAIYLFI